MPGCVLPFVPLSSGGLESLVHSQHQYPLAIQPSYKDIKKE
jgi:hypothetical protein